MPGAWTGPGGFTSFIEDTTLMNVPLASSGTYKITATLGSCTADEEIQVNVVSGPTVAIYPSPNDSICPGQMVTFVAVPTSAGTGAQYQWKLNGNPIGGATTTTHATTTIADGDKISMELTPGSGAACATIVNSNTIPMAVMPFLAPKVTMTATDDNAWPGVQVDFTAVATDAGANPQYQWKLNGNDVIGAISPVWGATTLNNNDSVCIEVTSSYICPQPKMVRACHKVRIATSVGSISKETNIRIYPNPANEQLTIEGVTKGDKVLLFDITGREVYSNVVTSQAVVIPTSQFVFGSYVLQLTDVSGQRLIEKVAISHE